MEKRGTMGEIKSLLLVISGDLGWCKKMSKCSSVLRKEEVARCVKEETENLAF